MNIAEWYNTLPPRERSKVRRKYMHEFGKKSATFYNKLLGTVRLYANEERFFNSLKTQQNDSTANT
jgi:hypothetical protein